MDDRQLAMLLTALSDQTAAMNRMADAMAGILLHLDPKQAAKFAAPGYQRPLAAYASFDWNSIDGTVIAFDRHGATEVEHNGVSYRRYRSNDDDPKGVDIRFRRVVSGTPEGKDMVWATLIKFADKRQKDPPRPLRGELAEKIEHAQADNAASADPAAEAQAAQRLGGTRREIPPPQSKVPEVNVKDLKLGQLERLMSNFKTLPPVDSPRRMGTVKSLMEAINKQAATLGVAAFEQQGGETLSKAETRLQAFLDTLIEKVNQS